jgi:hypothetical protein
MLGCYSTTETNEETATSMPHQSPAETSRAMPAYKRVKRQIVLI